MNRIQRARRAGRSRSGGFAGQFIQDIAAAASVATGHLAQRQGRRHRSLDGTLSPTRSAQAAPGAQPVGQSQPSATTAALRRLTAAVPGLLPRTFQLCIHCRQRPAGFWVSHRNGTTARRPWCLSCCRALDRDHYDMIPFGS